MVLHTLQRLGKVLFCECLPAYDIPEQSSYRAQARPYKTTSSGGRRWRFLLCILFCYYLIHFQIKVLEHKLAFARPAAP
jgi:hypothetical protein